MATYKERVKEDLDRWIAAGLVSDEKRDAILQTIPDARRLDAATALAWIGGLLLGIAIISFVAANWDGLPRLARFALVLAAFLVSAGAAAWAARRERPMLSNIALMIASLVFAAAIGLTGQIFDIAGDPRAASYASGLAAFALAMAGRSTGAATVGLVMIALGDFIGRDWFSHTSNDIPWMLVAAPLSAYLALRWGSSVLAHVSALAIIYCFVWFAGRTQADAGVFLFMSAGLAAMTAGARWLFTQNRPFAGVFYGWFACAALGFFAAAGYTPLTSDGHHQAMGVAHRLAWLTASGGLIALGRYDRHTLASAVGVLSMIGAISALLIDLGLNLMVSAGVFLVCAIAAIAAGLMLRRKAQT